MPINGVPQEGKHKSLGGKKVSSNGGNKGGGSGGCLIALLTFAAIGSGWLSMLLTGSGWAS